MGKFDVKNEEKAPLGTNIKQEGFSSGNTTRREVFSGTSKALNALQIKFDYGERNEGGGAIFGIPTSDNRIPEHED